MFFQVQAKIVKTIRIIQSKNKPLLGVQGNEIQIKFKP
jgi:hypothetical protein